MTASQTHGVTDLLNELIEICRDGEHGFRAAAAGIGDPTLRRLFESYAEQRAGFARELQAEAARRGGDPARSSDALGALPRGWMKVREAAFGNDEAAIVAECERGEDAAVRAYRDAVGQRVPGNTADLVERQYVQVKDAHDHVRMLERSQASKLLV
jgi:uncharacterized protein (TIGR02284 family)